MDRMLVTGAAGLIGPNFVQHVVERANARITALDELTYAPSREALYEVPPDRIDLVVSAVADAALPRLEQAPPSSSVGSRGSGTRPGWREPSTGAAATGSGGAPHGQATEAAYAAKGQ